MSPTQLHSRSSGCGAGVHFLRSPASPHPKVQGLVLYKPEENLQAGVLCSAEHSSDLSDLSPQRVHCPPSPALAFCRARARWQEVLGHLRGSCSSPWGLCSSTSAQVISLPVTGFNFFWFLNPAFFSATPFPLLFSLFHFILKSKGFPFWGLPCCVSTVDW